MADKSDEGLAELKAAFRTIRTELAPTIPGCEEIIEQLFICLLAGEHCLLEGVPGTARAATVSALARSCGLRLQRVHCTPDLKPRGLTGDAAGDAAGGAAGGQDASAAGEPAVDETSASPGGPIFSHLVLLDDIGRLAPKTHAVVQQAMQDGEIAVAGSRYPVPRPFMVIATRYRNQDAPADVATEPRDDRFMLKIAARYPSYHDEFRLAETPQAGVTDHLPQVLDVDRLLHFRRVALQVPTPPHVVHYALRMVRSTRVHEGETPDFVYEWIAMGAGPRAAHYLALAARMRAALRGKSKTEAADVKAVVHAVLRHRLVTNRNAQSNGVTPDRVIDRLVYEIPDRIEGDDRPPDPGEAPTFDVLSDTDWMG